MRMRPLALTIAAATLAPLPGAAQTSLPLGSVATVALAAGAPAELAFAAPGAGFLTVVVRAAAGMDVSLAVTDGELQTLPDGEADADVGGDLGAEQLVVEIPRSGSYRVVVESLSGAPAQLTVGATFLPSELAAAPLDADGSPSGAIEVQAGTSHNDVIDPANGDARDWFAIRVREAGTLTILTRVEGDGDLVLERFEPGSYRDAADYSDQDLEGVLGNESLTVDVEAGSTVYLRVSPVGGGEAVSYRLASGLIPG